MWMWHNPSQSNLNPNFPTSSQFPSSSYPHTPTPPIHTSQPSLLPFHAPSGYQHSEYSSNQSHPSISYPTPGNGSQLWHSMPSLEALSSSQIPSNHGVSLYTSANTRHKVATVSHPELPSQQLSGGSSNASLHMSLGGGVALGSAHQETTNVNQYHNPGSNSPFSVDFLLQKSAPLHEASSVGYGHAVSERYSNDQSSYTAMESFHTSRPSPAIGGCEGGLTHVEVGHNNFHGSSHSILPHVEQATDSVLPPTVTHRPFSQTDTNYNVPLCSDFTANNTGHPSVPTAAPPSHCNTTDKGDNFGMTLPPSEEEPYSPPELVLKEDENQMQSETTSTTSVIQSRNIDDNTRMSSASSNKPPILHSQSQGHSIGSFPGIDDDDDSNGDDNFPSGGFQLGVSPPSIIETNKPIKSLINAKYESSNSSSDMEDNNTSLQIESDKLDNEEQSVLPRQQSSPPPLVPVKMVTQPMSHSYEDDDDVFLPLSPKSPPPFEKKTPTSPSDADNEESSNENSNADRLHPHIIENSIGPNADDPSFPLSKGEQKTAVTVVGRRGRAAGKVLDETKLKIPLEKGWQRVVRARIAEGNAAPRVDICYVTPCKRRLRTFPEIQRYLLSNSISDLTIDHFTFSKKVNVGVVIDESTVIETTDDTLIHPRRGRPPKRSRILKQNISEGSPDKSVEIYRTSLEPHEIKTTRFVQDFESTPVSTVTVPPTHTFSSQLFSEEGHTITKVVNDVSDSAHMMTSSLPLPKAVPPLLSSVQEIQDNNIDSRYENKDKQLDRKRKTNAEDSPSSLVIKRPRGRPKGSINKFKSPTTAAGTASLAPIDVTPTPSRKGRKPKHITHITPPTSSMTMSTNEQQNEGASNHSNDNNSSQAAPYDSANENSSSFRMLLPKLDSSASTKDVPMARTRVIKPPKPLDDKERRRLLIKKVKKKADSTHRASQRRQSQQARRQREKTMIKQAKEHLEKVNKQKEAEWHQFRKSRLAKQREEQNQKKARERTLKLVEEIQQQEMERDRIMRMRQLEMEKAEQLRRPTEDLLVNDLMTLPPLRKLNWISLPPNKFADLLMVFEFSHSFEDFLELDRVPPFTELYAGLFNMKVKKEKEEEGGEGGENVIEGLMLLTIQLVKAVVHDGTKTYTMSGQQLKEVDVKEETVSEILRLYLLNKSGHSLQQICSILEQYPYQSLRPTDKTNVLAFLVNELLSSASLCREIDNRMEQISTLRRDKWKISLKLKRFRSRLTDVYGIHPPQKPIVYSGRGRPPKRAFLNTSSGLANEDGDSSDDEPGEGGANDPEEVIEDDAYYSEEETDEEIPSEKEDLQRRIKELKKKFVSVRSRIYTVTRQMRKFPLGQDRYTRQYWNLPEMGGVIIEGVETSHNEYLEKLFPRLEAEERKREKVQEGVNVDDSSNGERHIRRSRSPSVSSYRTFDSLAASEIPLSSQSSPYPALAQQGVWSTDSPTKYSDDTDTETLPTPTKDNNPLSEVTPVDTPPHLRSLPSTDTSPEKTFHPLEVQLTAKQGCGQEKEEMMDIDARDDDVTSHTPPLPPPLVHPSHTNTDSGQNTPKNETPPISPPPKLIPSTQSQIHDATGTSSNTGSMHSPSIVTSFTSTISASTASTVPSDSNTVPTKNSVMKWFSLFPRKPCELLHFIQGNVSTLKQQQQQQQQQQKQGVMVGNQYVMQGGYAYMTADGTIISQPVVQQVQVGYAVVGNTLVPQTQYILSQNPVALASGNQYVSLGNAGQVALAAAATGSGIQLANIGGNQYAIVQSQEPEVKSSEGAKIVTDDRQVVSVNQSQSLVPKLVESDAVQSSESGTLDVNGDQTKKKRKKKQREEQLNESSSAIQSDVVTTTDGQQQLVTLAIPTGTSGETQYVQIQADPRVLSGQYSYAIMPQSDGTSQIVLVENNSAGVASSGSELLELECPAASILDNEYEGHPWMVDITLMYADNPLPFLSEGPSEEKKEDEKPLQELLQDINKDLTQGWWTVSSPLEIDYLLRCLTMRGYREKSLHKLLQKNKDNICASLVADKLTTPPFNKDDLVVPSTKNQPKEEKLEEKSDKENEMEGDMDVDIEGHQESPNMETNTESSAIDHTPSSPLLDTKTPLSDTSSVVAHNVPPTADLVGVMSGVIANENDPFFPLEAIKAAHFVMNYLKAMETRLFDAHLHLKDTLTAAYREQDEDEPDTSMLSPFPVSRIADRLFRFEACVQRRYLKPPFKEKRSNVKQETTDEANQPPSPPEEPIALIKWRDAISQASSTSQLAVYMNQLEKCIAWEKSPMKVFCVVCQTGDNESLLLLCDSCDKGTHTYCCRPKLDAIPDGDWYCHICIANNSRKSVCGICQSSRGTMLHCTDCPKVFHKRCLNPPPTKIPTGPWVCPECRRLSRRPKSRGAKEDLVICEALLMELEEHEYAWPFLQPVHRKKVPDYYRVIKKPMDFQTIRNKLQDGKYSTRDSFATDVKLVFDNCSFYNEDNSEIGAAGHTMREFFLKRWEEVSL